MNYSRLILLSALLSVTIIFVNVIVEKYLSRIEINSQIESLNTILDTTHISLKTWANEEIENARIIANFTAVIETTKILLQLNPEKDTLLQSSAQHSIRNNLQSIIQMKNYQGFFIINTNNINLSSSRDSNVGLENLLISQPDKLNRLWNGEALITTPQYSDVPLQDSNGTLRNKMPTMFVAAPIYGSENDVIAILSLRINPKENFTSVLQRGRPGKSGETYSFNNEGVLLSGSRFVSQLESIGLIKKGENEILSIQIRDPGKNLLLHPLPHQTVDELPYTVMAKNALMGINGTNANGYRDYRGVNVIGAWLWDQDLGIGITTEIDSDEAYASLRIRRTIGIIVCIFTLCLLFILTRYFIQSNKIIVASREKLAGITSSAGNAIIMINNDECITFWNNMAEQMFGWSECEALGKNVHHLISLPETHQDSMKGFESFRYSGEGAYLNKIREVTAVKKNGDTFPIDLSLTAMKIDEQWCSVGIASDATWRKKIEHEIINEKEKAEQANQSKTQFLANITHEIRTPLNQIQGFVQLIELDKDAVIKHKINLKSIKDGSDQLLQLIDNILEISRLELEVVAVNNCVINLYDFINDIKQLYASAARDKGVIIKVFQSEELPIWIETDLNKLRYIATELLRNAVKYTSEGEITINFKTVPCDAAINDLSNPRVLLTITVSDSGCGISKKYESKIFENFEQVIIGSESNGGAGVGLSIIRNYLRILDGDISLESTEGLGSTFIVNVPIVAKLNEVVPSQNMLPPSINNTSDPIIDYKKTALEPITPEITQYLPFILRQNIQDAVESGNTEDLYHHIINVKNHNIDVYNHMIKLADDYDYDALIHLLKACKKDNEK